MEWNIIFLIEGEKQLRCNALPPESLDALEEAIKCHLHFYFQRRMTVAWRLHVTSLIPRYQIDPNHFLWQPNETNNSERLIR